MEVLTLLASVRDPAIFLFCVGSAFYLNRNYVSKTTFDEIVSELKQNLKDTRTDYVSKEKLHDVLAPIGNQLKNIGDELKQIKLFLQEIRK